MNFSMNVVEAVWISLNLITLILTLVLLIDARADRTAVRLLNGKARELAATGTVRRESFRVTVQALLLGVAVPGLFSDREAQLTPSVVMLIAVPAVLLVSSFLDYIDRKRMVVLVTADGLLVRNTTLDRIEQAVAAVQVTAQEASDHADKAYHEANSVNEKIAAHGAVLVQQGQDMAADRERNAASDVTIETTAEEVHDLHEGTAPEKTS